MRFLKKLQSYAYGSLIRRFLTVGQTFLVYRTYDIVFGRHIDAWEPDIIHSHDGVTLPAAAKAADRLGAKLVFDSHELEVHRSPPLSFLRRVQVHRMEQKYLPKADGVMAVTELASQYLAQEYGIKPPVVLFNAPPANPGPIAERWNIRARPDVRSELCLREKDFLFVYTGNITRNRGLELAILALSKLQGVSDPNGRFGTSYHLAAVGKIQGNQDQTILKLAEAHGIKDKVHLLPPVSPHRVAKYVSTANASIIPIIPVTLSYEFAMPNKLFEATLSGNPILCTDLLEMGRFVEDNELGMTFDPASPDDCAQKMIELVTNYSKFERDAARQEELKEKFSWENQERKLLKLYEEI